MNQLGLFELFTFVRLFFTFTLPVVLCTTLLLCFLYKHCTITHGGVGFSHRSRIPFFYIFVTLPCPRNKPEHNCIHILHLPLI
jgi:hypothetical protein